MLFKSLYPPTPPVPDKNVYELFFNDPEQNALPDYTLYVDAESGRQIRRSEFNERVRDAATALGAPLSAGGLGLSGEKGDIVGILSSNCIDYPTLVLGSLTITVPFALLSAYPTHFELVHLLRTSKSTVLFVHPTLLRNALKAAQEVGLSHDRIFILEGGIPGRKSLQDLIDDVKRRRTPREPVRPATKKTLAYLMFSSGTTGLPKAVMVAHGNIWSTIVSQLIAGAEDLKVSPLPPPTSPVVVLAVLPFYHTYGLISFCMRPMSGYVTCVIVPRWNVEVVVRAIEKHRIGLLLLVPSMVHQLVHSGLLEKADLSSVDLISTGGAYMPPKVAERIQKLIRSTPRVMEGYGLSECTLSALRKPAPGALGGIQPILNSTGILLPSMEAKLTREDGSCVEIGEPGELWLRGDNIALGYFNDENATKETFIDGWLRSGDRFKTDGKGTFFFVDRIKDTLKISGAQVSPTEIEDVLLAHPGKLISDTSVAGVSGGRTADELLPKAWVVLSEEGRRKGADVVLKELDMWANENLSSYKRLRGGLEVVSEIPKSPTGKVLRRVLQDRHEQALKAKVKAKL
ncbi:unnamed protein product [Somion occarium]|uniref:Acetyl-CoA synthetase-like protein n=1 Tax=Somion occarium TaxID=3059160 RepID=A0ABP1DZP6_9APHY